MKNHSFLIILFLSIVLLSCNPTRNVGVQSEPYITFTEGGGFSGIMKSWILTMDGSVFIRDVHTDSSRYHGKINSRYARQIFQNIEEVVESGFDIDKPGNLYREIQYSEGDMKWVYDPERMKNLKINIVYNNFRRLLNTAATKK